MARDTGSKRVLTDLDAMVIYARGWNEAIGAAAQVARDHRGVSPQEAAEDVGHNIARDIMDLDKSMEAIDD